MKPGIRLGVSTCLLGEKVRYDGQHKRDTFIVNTLGPLVEFVPVCPEVECGLTIPREAMRLVGDPDSPRLMTIRSKVDLTDQMQRWIPPKLDELAKANLHGFIFKAKSPSSGMERVKIYHANGNVNGSGSGLFAKAFMERFPLLPVEEEGRLHDPMLRENFIERIFTLKRYRDAVANKPTLKALTGFHAHHKYLLMSHAPAKVSEMGRILAGATAPDQAVSQYEELLLTTLKLKSTVAKHINVLQHMAGYLKNTISSDEKAEFAELIDLYRASEIPLISLITMMRHYVRKHAVSYLATQAYLYPHPLELQLRNHA